MTGSLDPGQLALAAAKADKSDGAKKLIQEAGSGLMEVFQSTQANAVTLGTCAKMAVVMGYLTEAQVLLLENVALSHEPPKVPDGIVLPV